MISCWNRSSGEKRKTKIHDGGSGLTERKHQHVGRGRGWGITKSHVQKQRFKWKVTATSGRWGSCFTAISKIQRYTSLHPIFGVKSTAVF